MLNRITIGKYYYGVSLIHRWNPVCKLFCSLLFILSVFAIEQWLYVFIYTIYLLFLLQFSGLSFSCYVKPIWGLRYMLLILFLFYFILGISYEQSILLVWKLVSVILYSTMVLYTTSIGDLTYALTCLFYPLFWIGIPTYLLSRVIGLALSFLPNILEHANQILKSLTVRGMDYKRMNIKQKLYIWKIVLFPLFDNSMRYADAVADTMEVRLYSTNQFHFRKNSLQFMDILGVLFHISLCILVWKDGLLCGI